MANWIWKEPPTPDRPESAAKSQTSALDPDQVYFESAFRSEWIAQFAALSNDSVGDANGNLPKDGSAGPWTTSNASVVGFDDATSDGWSPIASWFDSWIADGRVMVPVPYGDGSRTLPDGSLPQFDEQHHTALAVTKPLLDASDNAATDGHPEGAQFGHATSPVGSSTPPSIVMDVSIPLGIHGESFFAIADEGLQAWTTPRVSGVANIATLAPVADNAPAPSPPSLVFDHPFQPPDLSVSAAHLNPNHAPAVSINHPFSETGEWSNVGGWVSYSDADGDAAVQYQFRDDGLAPNSAYLSTPANAHNPAGTIITVAPADLNNVLVHSGDPNTSDTMWVRAFDGSDWSAWAPVYFATTASDVSYGADITVQIAPSIPVVQIIPGTPAVQITAVAQPGPDTFLFQPNSGTTAISHFDLSEDVIRFQGTSLADFAAVLDHTADNGHGDTVIAYDAHSAITLEGVTRDMLHASNFQLV